MAKRIKDSWSDRRRRAVLLAEELVANTVQSLPVDLRRISERRAVQRIEFAPLLTEGGLAVRDDGFVIYVRCDSAHVAELTARLSRDGTGKSLPRELASRARFTIAHEIAHTLFYDIKSLPPRAQIQIDTQELATKLELVCNRIAGLILMPENLIAKFFAMSHFVRPEELRELADTAMASVEAVVRRFSQLRRVAHPEAILASVVREEKGWTITAISRHYSLRGVFTGAKMGAPLETLVGESAFELADKELREVNVEYVGHGGVRKKMQFAREIAISNSRGFFVVGVPIP